jgi:hypothetical protein
VVNTKNDGTYSDKEAKAYFESIFSKEYALTYYL